MNRKFSIELVSDLDFEGMVIEVNFQDQIVAQLNYDKGIDDIEIEMSPDPDTQFIFPLEDFLIALEKAKKLAIQCAEEDRLRKEK